MSHQHSGPDQRRATGNHPAAILEALDAMARATDPGAELSPAAAAGARMGAWLRVRFGPEALCAPLNAATVAGRISADMARIDALLTAQLNAILRHPRFRQLEASWRGLAGLCAARVERCEVQVLSLSWAELGADFARSGDLEGAQLFRLVHDGGFGMPGGAPFGLLLADYEVPMSPPGPGGDIAILSALASLGAAAFAPVIAAAGPGLFGLDQFAGFDRLRQGSPPAQLVTDARFASLRGQDDARFLCLAMPRVLARAPYTPANCRPGFHFREDGDGLRHEDLCWATPVYAIGARIMGCFDRHGWFADICRDDANDPDGAATATCLPPTLASQLDAPGVVAQPGCELAMPPALENALWREGLLTLNRRRGTSRFVMRAAPTVQAIPDGATIGAVNARISAMLGYVLCVSRFAHYLKVIVRDRVGAFATSPACEAALQRWLDGYCIGDDAASPEMKARFPLREARVTVRPCSWRNGAFGCVIHLRPHVQLDQINATFRLVTSLGLLPEPGRSGPVMLAAAPAAGNGSVLAAPR